MIPPTRILDAENLLNFTQDENWLVIDARSEAEFEADHILDAINLPVLKNEERVEVGCLYKKKPFEARILGAQYISKNIPDILDFIKKTVTREKKICVYCWRGGMRSKSLFLVLYNIGYDVYILRKGYKGYRKLIVSFFENASFNLRVIYGPSGSGKSDLINAIKTDGYAVVNLEEMAAHKGSLLGGSYETQPSQKMFESRLFHSLFLYKQKSNFAPVIVEGESRKIGKIILPDTFFKAMIAAEKIWIELPIKKRAERLAKEYDGLSAAEIFQKIEKIKKYFSNEVFEKLSLAISENNKQEAAALLLQYHYDTYYFKRKKEMFQKKIIVTTWNQLYADMKSYLAGISADSKII